MVVDKILFNWLRWMGPLVLMEKKSYRGSIYDMIEKENFVEAMTYGLIPGSYWGVAIY